MQISDYVPYFFVYFIYLFNFFPQYLKITKKVSFYNNMS